MDNANEKNEIRENENENKSANDVSKTDSNSNPGGSKPKKKRILGIFKSFMTLVIAVIIIALAGGSVFGFLIHSNYYGFADKFRKHIEKIPVINLILPPEYDPEKPELMPRDVLISKYEELKLKKKQLETVIDDLNNDIRELSKHKEEADNIKAEEENIKKSLADQQIELDTKIREYKELKKTLDEKIASMDRTGFKEYFTSIDPENAPLIYEKVVREGMYDSTIQSVSEIYKNMNPADAADILEEMGPEQIDLVVDILRSMDRKSSAAIMSQMKKQFAAKISEVFSLIYPKQFVD